MTNPSANPSDSQADPVEQDEAQILTKKLHDVIRRRTPFHHDKVPFVVCWSQKAGCTTILKWFLYHAGLLDEALAYREKNNQLNLHNYENNVLKKRKGYRVELVNRLADPGTRVIYFMRCPYERAYSSYLHMTHPRLMLDWAQGATSQGIDIRQSILEFTFGKDVLFERPIPFADYLRWVKAQDPETLNHHHTPQVTPLFELVDMDIFRLKTFDSVAAQLEQEYGLADSSSQQGLADSKHHVEKTPLSDDTVFELLETGIPLFRTPEFQVPRVTKSLLMGTPYQPLIEELFARDIEIFESLA